MRPWWAVCAGLLAATLFPGQAVRAQTNNGDMNSPSVPNYSEIPEGGPNYLHQQLTTDPNTGTAIPPVEAINPRPSPPKVEPKTRRPELKQQRKPARQKIPTGNSRDGETQERLS